MMLADPAAAQAAPSADADMLHNGYARVTLVTSTTTRHSTLTPDHRRAQASVRQPTGVPVASQNGGPQEAPVGGNQLPGGREPGNQTSGHLPGLNALAGAPSVGGNGNQRPPLAPKPTSLGGLIKGTNSRRNLRGAAIEARCVHWQPDILDRQQLALPRRRRRPSSAWAAPSEVPALTVGHMPQRGGRRDRNTGVAVALVTGNPDRA